MSLARAERIKLLANALDRASTACFTVGIATPLAGYVYNVGGLRDSVGDTLLAFGILGWLTGATLLHLMARRVLGSLDRS